jgi:hypothetical protein
VGPVLAVGLVRVAQRQAGLHASRNLAGLSARRIAKGGRPVYLFSTEFRFFSTPAVGLGGCYTQSAAIIFSIILDPYARRPLETKVNIICRKKAAEKPAPC